MKRTLLPLLTAALMTSCATSPETLKEALADQFFIGTALNEAQIDGADSLGVEITKRHFNSVVAENCMKSEEIHPTEDTYNFELPDKFVDFGERNNMFIIGHTLLWHSQLAPWFCVDAEGKDVSREVLIERLKEHITTVVTRYKGRVDGWDVVNEAILDDGSLRPSKFYEIIGEDYIRMAFEFAHAADPDAELYYNDYSMSAPGKRATVVKLVNDLRAEGVRIDGVGMQGHVGLDYPDIADFEESIKAYAATGAKVMITEWDITVLPTVNRGAEVADTFEYRTEMNPYPNGMPAEVEQAWNARMKSFMELFLSHSDVISRVTLWGVSDGDSWRNNWPMPGRCDYPLFFDRDHQLKPAVAEVVYKNK